MVSKTLLQEELKASMKAGSALKTSVLRMLLAAISNKEKEKRFKASKSEPGLSERELDLQSRLSEAELLDVVSSEAKKRREAIEGFEKGGNRDMAEQERTELGILMAHLPSQLTEEEIRELAKEAISVAGAASQKDIGKVMSVLAPKTKSRADGALVSKIVKDLLGAG
ncbi:MAG: GatB/YqeY domain-containing protein [Candidatus Wildermuthbacteria bacterium]|nr:GatB/YqeY domain-containing protein [Candidatus Wildermuthbacteria bacterium]